jgi:hypothetical protein
MVLCLWSNTVIGTVELETSGRFQVDQGPARRLPTKGMMILVRQSGWQVRYSDVHVLFGFCGLFDELRQALCAPNEMRWVRFGRSHTHGKSLEFTDMRDER